MGIYTGYAGTYDSPESQGLYRFTLDSSEGRLSPALLFFKGKNVKCAAPWGSELAIILETEAGAGVGLLDVTGAEARLLDSCLPEKITSCFIAQEETQLFTANYHEGTICIYEKDARGVHTAGQIQIAPGAGCHQVLFHGGYLLVPCLELDSIRLFDRQTKSPAGEIRFPTGSGPRHGIFNRGHTRFFAVGERSCMLYPFSVGALGFVPEPAVSLLPGQTGGGQAAALRLSPDERFLYASVRGADLITVYDIAGGSPIPVQYAPCAGAHPRDFLLSPDGRCLICVNRVSGNLVCFLRDEKSGKLSPPCSQVRVPDGIGLAIKSK